MGDVEKQFPFTSIINLKPVYSHSLESILMMQVKRRGQKSFVKTFSHMYVSCVYVLYRNKLICVRSGVCSALSTWQHPKVSPTALNNQSTACHNKGVQCTYIHLQSHTKYDFEATYIASPSPLSRAQKHILCFK